MHTGPIDDLERPRPWLNVERHLQRQDLPLLWCLDGQVFRGLQLRACAVASRPFSLRRSFWARGSMVTMPTGAAVAGRYYTPWHICVATLIAGPLAGGFFASRDHVFFGAKQKATATLLVSLAVVVAAVAVGSRMRPDTGATVIAALISVAYRWYAEIAFSPEIAKRQRQGWTPQSWWRVLAISFAFLMGLLLIVLGAIGISLRVSTTGSSHL